ncbi:DUF721 domain-containing protein [Desulfovibrio sp. OttesenSCG-928-A18]|nr:DUF721 domain-containing protein [Desulfovibrio sp. OttesenSCG-928-A18]
MKKKKGAFSRRSRRMKAAGEAAGALLLSLGGKQQRHLAALWDNWNLILGEELDGLGLPLGHKDGTLYIGADDSMALQELSMYSMEILERANAFMDSHFFNNVKVELMQGRRNLAAPRLIGFQGPALPALPPRPDKLGALRDKLDKNSPVAQCYEAYLALFEQEGSNAPG